MIDWNQPMETDETPPSTKITCNGWPECKHALHPMDPAHWLHHEEICGGGRDNTHTTLQETINMLDEMTQDRDMWKLKCEDMAARKGNPSMDCIIATSERLGDTGKPPDETGDSIVEEVQKMLDAAVSKPCDNCGMELSPKVQEYVKSIRDRDDGPDRSGGRWQAMNEQADNETIRTSDCKVAMTLNKHIIIGGAAGAAAWTALITFAGWGFDPASWTPDGRFTFLATLVVCACVGAAVAMEMYENE